MAIEHQSPHGEDTQPDSQVNEAGEANDTSEGVDWKAMARKWEARAKRSHTRIAQLEADAKTHAGQVKEAVEAAEAPLRERIGQLEHAEQPRARATQAATEANVARVRAIYVAVTLVGGALLAPFSEYVMLIFFGLSVLIYLTLSLLLPPVESVAQYRRLSPRRNAARR